MDVADYIGFVVAEGRRFATAAERGPLDVDIDACEGWDMGALVRHLGLIHLWAAGNVAYPHDDWLDADDIPDMGRYWPELGSAWPDDDQLVTWYRQTLANLVRVLESAPPDHQCFSFLPAPTPVTMWARRQASEIAIHRFDAEAARGLASQFDAEFASDMLDELLSGFAPRHKQIAIDAARGLSVHATDIDRRWSLTVGPDGMTIATTDSPADLTIAGTAAELYLLLWNRTSEHTVTLTGDTDLLAVWRDNQKVVWSGG